ncbi:hypothetical protein GCM10009672_23910 [Nesterenkonia lutea]
MVIRLSARISLTVTHVPAFNRRAADILGYFDRPGTPNEPTKAINARLEHFRGTALGFRNLAHYIARPLLDTGGFRPLVHRTCDESHKFGHRIAF